MSALNDYLNSRAIRTNPAYAKQAAIDDERRYNQAQAAKMAAMADYIYGRQSQPGQPAQGIPFSHENMRPATPGQPGTGIFQEGLDPETKYNLMQQRMFKTGLTGYQGTAADMLKNMQNSMMAKVSPAKFTNTAQKIIEAGFVPGTPEFQEQMKIQLAKTNGTTVHIQDGSKTRMGTPEENRKWGYPADLPTYWAKDGSLKPAKNVSEAEAKRQSFFQSMSSASESLKDISELRPDFDPANTADFIFRELDSDEDSSTLAKVISGKMQSTESKLYYTAALDWVSANRAYISGAAVPEVEVRRDFKTYFPMPGDSPEVLQLKANLRANREEAIASVTNLDIPQEEKEKMLEKGNFENRRKLLRAMLSQPSSSNTGIPTSKEELREKLPGLMNDGIKLLNKALPEGYTIEEEQ